MPRRGHRPNAASGLLKNSASTSRGAPSLRQRQPCSSLESGPQGRRGGPAKASRGEVPNQYLTQPQANRCRLVVSPRELRAIERISLPPASSAVLHRNRQSARVEPHHSRQQSSNSYLSQVHMHSSRGKSGSVSTLAPHKLTTCSHSSCADL
jgi:hypothetical protein